MSQGPGGLLAYLRRRGAPSEADLRRQLTWFAWLRLIVVTTALFTTLLLDVVIRLDRMSPVNTEPLYAILVAAYAMAFLDLGLKAVVRRTDIVAAVQFGGDLLLETALLLVLGHVGAVAFALALFFLTTFLACSYLGRAGRFAFATAALALQVVVLVLSERGVLDLPTMTGRATYQLAGLDTMVLHVFTFMFTFYGTAWLVGSRAERLRTMGDRLQRVSADLADLQAFNELVVRGMTAGLVTTDSDGVVIFSNRAAQELLAREAEGLRGQPFLDVLGWADFGGRGLDAVVEGSGTLRASGASTLAGRARSLDVRASVLRDRDAAVLGILFLLEDVTELRELEGEVRLKDRMAAIGEMAAGIAHEIRNPLASISGSVQMLQRQLDLPEEPARLMDIVLRESSRLDSTIGEFLEFARPRALRVRQVDLAELGRETVLLLRNSQEVSELHELVAPDEGPVLALADPDSVRQVLWNLCKNALRAMPRGGTLTVVALRQGDDAVLAVSDTGTGMLPSVRARAFQPLVGEFEGGMGLGLAIVYRIVKDHNGRVLIDSVPNAGTRVEVRLPVAGPAGPAGPGGGAASGDGGEA